MHSHYFLYFLFFLHFIPFSLCLSSLPLHLFFLPPQTLLSFSTDPSPICTSPVAIDPSPSTHARPLTSPISASLLYFRRFSFVFQAGFLFWFGCVDFSAFFFCSYSLVLMGTTGCDCAVIFMGLMVVVVVCWWVNEILFYYIVYIILLC